MPSSEQILQGLTRIANQFLPVAAAWHALVLAAVVGIVFVHWKPIRRRAVRLLSLPLVSVSVLAWATGNPFNGTTFALLVVATLSVAPRVPLVPAALGAGWAVAVGTAALAFAWIYPHFLESRSPLVYFAASPIGLVPCPTLSMVLGFGLIAGGFGSRAWSLLMGGAGVFYALFGMFRLGVWLDAGLLVAAVAILPAAFRPPRVTDASGPTALPASSTTRT